MLDYGPRGLCIVTMEGGTQFGEKGQVPVVYHADIQVALRAIWHRCLPEVGRCSCKNWRPLPTTQPAQCEIQRGGGWAQAEAQNEQVRSIPA